MKNSKLTKLVALASVLLVSVATLAGSTVAWFTDTEEVVNTIQSGDLDVELQYKVVDPEGKLSDNWLEVEDNKQIFKENALYEPGYTEFVLLKVRNAGNLALQYRLSVDANNTVVGASAGQKGPKENDHEVKAGDPIYLSDHLKLVAFPIEIAAKATEETAESTIKTTLSIVDDDKVSRSKVRELIGDTVTDGADGQQNKYISHATRGLWNGKSTTGDKPDLDPVVIQKYVAPAEGQTATNVDIKDIELWPDTAEDVTKSYDLYGLVLYMPEETTNEANNRKVDDQGAIINPEIQLGIKLEAAQVVEQADSFDEQYDRNATYDGQVYSDTTSEEYKANVGGAGNIEEGFAPGAQYNADQTEVTVYTYEQLNAAAPSSAGKLQRILLGQDITMTGDLMLDKSRDFNEKILDLNGKQLNLNSKQLYSVSNAIIIEDSKGGGKITGNGEGNEWVYATSVGNSLIVKGGTIDATVVAYQKNELSFENCEVKYIELQKEATVDIGENAYVKRIESTENIKPHCSVMIRGGRVDEINVISNTSGGGANITITGGEVGKISIADADSTITIDGGTITGDITITAGTVKVKDELTAIRAKLAGYAQDISEPGYTIYTAATASA